LCYLLLFVGALAFGEASGKSQPVVGLLIAGSPADKAGMHVGDKIVAIDGQPVAGGDTLVKTIHESKGRPLTIVYSRGDVQTTARMSAVPCPPTNPPGQWCIGFNPVPAYERVGFGEAVVGSGIGFVNIADGTVGSLVLLVTHFTKYAGQTAGVIGMGQAATTIQDWGWGPYFGLAAMISFALGLFNLLPIPALDGGRAAFIVAELVRGKPVDPDKEAMVHFAGLAALMALMLLVAFHDILRIANGNGVL
jgi:regulator of sigma E protease